MEKYLFNLQWFNNTNLTTDTTATTGNDLSVEMKTYYTDYLIDNAEPNLIHDQFGQKQPIPKNGGKTIEFRKYDPLPKAMNPLQEGVTPQGRKMNVSNILATVQQYGDYIEVSDVLLLTAIDNNLVQATKLIGSQAGRTLDTVTREVLNGGTSVQIGEGMKSARYQLVGGENSGNDYFSVMAVKKGVRALKVQNAEKIDGSWVAIAHPDTLFDLMNDPAWVDASLYAQSTQIFEGEVGKIAGVRFVETTEAKVFHAENLTAAARNLTVSGYNANVITVSEAISSAEATAMANRQIIVNGELYTVASCTAGSAGAATITIKETPTINPSSGNVVYPGEAGAKGRDVYSTLLLGDNAYGVTEVTGGGLQHIYKPLGSAGAADPLNQRATVGWKALKTAERLVEQFMVRIETASTFEVGAN